jgi:hypothetical protein
MVEISKSGSEGAPGGQLPGATREASHNHRVLMIAPIQAEGKGTLDWPSADPTASWTASMGTIVAGRIEGTTGLAIPPVATKQDRCR